MTPEYRKLRLKWYQKLKQSGFNDIEDTNSPREMLKDWHSTWFFRHSDPLHFKCKHRYFRMCERFLNSHRFKNRLEKNIWKHHSNGLSIRQIAYEINSTRDIVHYAIERLRSIMRRGF